MGEAYTSSTISNSYSTGAVTGNFFTGGLVGQAYGNVSNSYATCMVTGTDWTGGLVGRAFGNINNSYATGNVSGSNYTGGLVGCTSGNNQEIDCSYSGGKVSGNECVGGLVGYCHNLYIDSSVSYSKVSGNAQVGSFIGAFIDKYIDAWDYPDDDDSGSDEYEYELTLVDCKSAVLQNINMVGVYVETYMDSGYEDPETGDWIDTSYDTFAVDEDYDMDALLSNIENYNLLPTDTNFQVGINGDASSQINIDTNFRYDLSAITKNGIESDEALNSINQFIDLLSRKQTELGAASNRLESALDSTLVSIENLTSSLSTIRDADVAKVSSDYIRQQILQQASATLLATANQSPALVLQLLGGMH